MASVGYSGRPLHAKLGIKEEMNVALINAPTGYFALIEKDISSQLCNSKEIPDFLHFFVRTAREFQSEMKKIRKIAELNPKIIVWVSWYKKSSGIVTDVT